MALGPRRVWRLLAVITLVACPSPSTDATPPSPPNGAPTTTQSVSTFAIDSIVLGDLNPTTGAVDNTGWKLLGYDLDRKTTAKNSTDVCMSLFGAPPDVRVDGVEGRDNSFGDTVLPIVETMRGPICVFSCADAGPLRSLTNDESAAIDQGGFTLQIQVTGLSDDPAQTASGLTAQVFTSGAFDVSGVAFPAFDPMTSWPVQPESLNDAGSIASGAIATFQQAYVSKGTFVAGTNELVTVPFFVVIDGFSFTLRIHSAIITFDHTSSNHAQSGVIAGVLDVNELMGVFKHVLHDLSPTFCDDTLAMGITTQVAQGAEILVDRSNPPGVPCTGVSIGMGFHAFRVANPTVIAAPIVNADPCDAGADATGD